MIKMNLIFLSLGDFFKDKWEGSKEGYWNGIETINKSSIRLDEFSLKLTFGMFLRGRL